MDAVEVVTLTGLVRYFVLFVIDVRSRRVQIRGSPTTCRAHGRRRSRGISQTAATAFLRDARYLIHDRDPMFTRQFIAITLDSIEGSQCASDPPPNRARQA
jgi:hypothetical protein